jgi:hypothetical protein
MRALRYSGRYFVGTSCGAASGQLFVAAERHATTARARAWLAAVTSYLWSTMAAVCFWGAI